MFYRYLIRPILFRCDPEWAHDQAIAWSRRAQHMPGFVGCCTWLCRETDARLSVDLAGIPLANPIGLAAGYDKSGRAISAMASLGFGHIEIGSISCSMSPGNPKPRLWRLPRDEAVCVHYGLPNDGASAVSEHLSRQSIDVPLGINLVNTNRGIVADRCDADDILNDYVESATVLQGHASYLMLNLSCPNTSEGREFFDQDDHLASLLQRLDSISIDVPVFLKITPDADESAMDRMLCTTEPFGFVKGFMFNLSATRRSGLSSPSEAWCERPGAISGTPTRDWIDQRVAWLYRTMDQDRYQIVAAGGVSTAEDAYRKLRAGASAVQLLTALIYQGPGVVRRINHGLLKRMEHDGVANIGDIVGVDA